MSRARFNPWPTHASMAETLTNAEMLHIDRREAIDDMTYDELLGTEQVLIDRRAGIDAAMQSLMELRVKTNTIIRMLEERQYRDMVDDEDGE